jgi:hypothetical protein
VNKIEPRIWKRTILQGEDEARLAELDAEVDRLEVASRRSGGSTEALEAALAARNEFAVEAEGRGVAVTLRAVGRKKWRELVEQNPPREGDEADQKAGINLDTFPESLVPACITGPTMGEGEMDDFLDSLSPAQFDTLALAAWSLHKSLGADPKERRLSVLAES